MSWNYVKKFHFFPPALICSAAAAFTGNTRMSPGFEFIDGTVWSGGIVIGLNVNRVGGLTVGLVQPGIAENQKVHLQYCLKFEVSLAYECIVVFRIWSHIGDKPCKTKCTHVPQAHRYRRHNPRRDRNRDRIRIGSAGTVFQQCKQEMLQRICDSIHMDLPHMDWRPNRDLRLPASWFEFELKRKIIYKILDSN